MLTKSFAVNPANSPFALYEKLKKLDAGAICFLLHKTQKHVDGKKHLAKASAEDVEELTNDAVLLALQKILNGTYVFQGYSPLTFALVIADNLLRNFCRKKRLACRALEDLDLPAAAEIEEYLDQKEIEKRISLAFDSLDEVCRLLIRLKYFDNLRDEEIIERGLTPYSTVDSLKTKRCACMRRLKEMLKVL